MALISYEEWCHREGMTFTLPRLKFKAGSFYLHGRWMEAIRPLLETAPAMHDGVVLITDGGGGRHGDKSLHFHGDALDVRILGFREGGILLHGLADPGTSENGKREYEAIQYGMSKKGVGRLARRLSPDWDVEAESDHMHLECDPS